MSAEEAASVVRKPRHRRVKFRGGRHIGFAVNRPTTGHSKRTRGSSSPLDVAAAAEGIALNSENGKNRPVKRRRFGGFRGARRDIQPKRNDARLSIETAVDTNSNANNLNSNGKDAAAGTSQVIKDEVNNAEETNKVWQNASAVQDQQLSERKKVGKRRGRRCPKRKWKPYFKLTPEERRLLELREERRAERVRELRFKSGLPVAPYNTTQFLFDDLQRRGGAGPRGLGDDVDVIVENIRHRRHKRSEDSSTAADALENDRPRATVSSDAAVDEPSSTTGAGAASSDSEYMSNDDDSWAAAGEMFNAQEFDDDYDAAFVERLSKLTRDQLIAEYLQLEKQYERARREADQAQADLARLQRRVHAPPLPNP